MKRITAISFLFLFFMAQLGYYFIYSHQQYISKKEVKERMLAGAPDSCLFIIEQTDAIHWEEKGKEFYLNSELYDVVKVKNEKGKTWLYCINDKKEEQVLQNLSKAVKSTTSDSANEKSGKQSIKFQFKIYDTQSICLLTEADPKAQQNPYALDPTLISSFREVSVPPPRA